MECWSTGHGGSVISVTNICDNECLWPSLHCPLLDGGFGLDPFFLVPRKFTGLRFLRSWHTHRTSIQEIMQGPCDLLVKTCEGLHSFRSWENAGTPSGPTVDWIFIPCSFYPYGTLCCTGGCVAARLDISNKYLDLLNSLFQGLSRRTQ